MKCHDMVSWFSAAELFYKGTFTWQSESECLPEPHLPIGSSFPEFSTNQPEIYIYIIF